LRSITAVEELAGAKAGEDLGAGVSVRRPSDAPARRERSRAGDDFIEDLRRIGVTGQQLDPLFRSAAAYVNAWEHAVPTARTLNPDPGR